MRQIQRTTWYVGQPELTKFSIRQRLMSGSLTLAMTGGAGMTAAMAHTSGAPLPIFTGATTPAVHSYLTSGSLSGAPLVHWLHPVVSNTSSGHGFTHLATTAVTQAPAAGDVNLASSVAMFPVSSLAGFQNITIDIGGHQTTVQALGKLTGAELVAAEQVATSGKQTLVVNGSGVATGGTLNLNTKMDNALVNALNNNFAGLDISKGVTAVDTLSNLSLSGSLANQGKLEIGGAGQTIDTISAANITNSSSASISGVSGTAVGLNAASTFSNSGKITSGSDLSVSAPKINNSGLLSSTGGNVNLAGCGGGGGGNLTVNGTGGTVHAANNINIDTSAGNGNLTASGGNWQSQNLNLNAGTGAINANVDQVTGVVNATAECAHITASTANLQLGEMNVSGDPTFYNQTGNIVVNGLSSFTDNVAIVASGNIIGNGGALTLTTSGDTLTLVAGANFAVTGATQVPSTNTSGSGDTTSQITITDSTNAGLGSKTGGFIDLSGATLTSKNLPVTNISTNSGNITMIAYKGSASNSGSIVGTATAKQTTSGPSTTIDAGTAGVQLIGGGAQLTAQNINGGNISVLAGTPTVGGAGNSVQITDGAITNAGSWSVLNGKASNTAVNVTNLHSSGNSTVTVGTAGKLSVASGGTLFGGGSDTLSLTFGSNNSTAKAPVSIDVGKLTVNALTASGSAFLKNLNGTVVFFGNSNLGTGGTLSLITTGGITLANNSTLSAGTIIFNDSSNNGIVSIGFGSPTGGLISGGTLTVTETSPVSLTSPIILNTAVNTVAANDTKGGVVALSEFASSAKSLTVNTSAAFGNFSLTSTQPVNIKGNITTTNNGNIDITESGTNTVTGINIAGVLKAGSNNINLTTSGTDGILASKTITAANLDITAGGVVGSSSGLPTDVSSGLAIFGSSISNQLIAIKDSGTGTFTVTGVESTSQPVSITSVAATVNVQQLAYSGVTITDTATVAKVPAVINITPGAAEFVGDGTGVVKITAVGSINQTGSGGVSGSSINLTSTTGSIGSGTAISVGGLTTSTVTANATKNTSTVSLATVGNINLNTGTSGSYTVGGFFSVNIIGTITANTKTTGTITINSPLITQGSTTAYLVAPKVVLITLANGSIGVGPGAQSIQTKATTDLSIEGAAGSAAFVTQNGTINLAAGSTVTAGAGSTLNLFMAPANTLTISGPIAWDNNNLTASNTVTVATGGSITGTTFGITAPTIINNVAGGINVTGVGAAGVATFTSPSALALSGTGTVTMLTGNSLNLNGTSSITLGTAGAAATDPLNGVIKGGNLGNLTITSNGAFTGSYTSFTTTGSLSVTASSIRNGTAVVTAFGLNSGTGVSLALNGAYTVGSGNFDLTASTNGATISASASGALTVTPSGLNFNGTTGNSIALKGATINTNAVAATYFTTDNTFGNVSLVATTGTFTLGATTTTTLNNGIAGGVTATAGVTIAGPSGITVNAGSTPVAITGSTLLFNTSNFKLNGSNQVVGTGAGILTIASSGGLAISGTGGPNNAGGTYTNIEGVTLQAATAGVNVGNLFTTVNGAGNMLDSSSVGNIVISAAGSITLPTTLNQSALQVSPGGNIFLSAAAIAYSPGKGLFLSLQAPSGLVTLSLSPATPSTSTLTLGKTSGAIDLQVGSTGSFFVSSTGNVVVNEALSVGDAEVNGLNVTFNQPVTTTSGLGSTASGSPISMITEAPGVTLTGAFLGLSQGLQTMPTTPLIVNSTSVVVGQGALNVQNNFNGSSKVSAVNDPLLPLTALKYVASSNTSSSTLTVGTIIATAGGISITNLLGTMQVGGGALLQTAAGNIMVPAGTDGTKAGPPGTFESAPTMGGNIVLQNNDASSNIFITQSIISAFGTAGSGLGNVFITRGTAPVAGLAAGSQPTPFPPLVTTSGGSAVFYTTTANPNGSITSGSGNQLKALGANIVFNGAGNSSYIQLGTGVTITADPPAVNALSAALHSSSASFSEVSGVGIAQSTSGSSASIITNGLLQSTPLNSAGQLPINNWSLPSTTTFNANLASGIGNQGGVAAIGDSDVVNGGAGALGLRRLSAAGSKVLSGGVSDTGDSVETLDSGVTFMAPKKATTVNTAFGPVQIAAGSVVMVMAFDGGIAVYNLHDTKAGAVQVEVGDQVVKLSPGQNAVMTSRQINCFEEINPAQFVGYRSMTAKDWGNGVKGFTSEFSIGSMLSSVGALRDMTHSTDTETRKAINSMLKTCVILSQLGGQQYQSMVLPPKTAMALKQESAAAFAPFFR